VGPLSLFSNWGVGALAPTFHLPLCHPERSCPTSVHGTEYGVIATKRLRIRSTISAKMNALQTLLKTDPVQVDGLSIEQVLALCGSGKLTDNSQCSRDFREYLQVAKSDRLIKYSQTCLQERFDAGPLVLQDVVNEFGRRLDYAVENGLYKGKVNAIGFDGVWTDVDGRSIVVEVKTTDTYRINLDTIDGYREALITAGKVSKDSSVLIVVGRQDTGDLEAQVRGSKHAWTIRIISSDALATLVTLKENTEQADSVKRIHELLVPFEYTRLDRIIEIAFAVTEDAKTALEEEQAALPADLSSSTSDGSTKQQHTSPEIIAAVRANIIAALSARYSPLVKKSRALYWSADKSLRVVVTVSKRYGESGYWYAYHLPWDKFLGEGQEGLYVLGCVGRNEAFAIPYQWIHARVDSLNFTEREDGKHWHILLYPADEGQLVLRLKNGKNESLDGFKFVLSEQG
jgi:hypothetical protein